MIVKVIKRSGEVRDFDIEKIHEAIRKAFVDVTGGPQPRSFRIGVEKEFAKDNGTLTVEDIQDKVEELLMAYGYYDVAKSYILYRAEHADIRLLKERQEYIDNYILSGDNAATTSETDANANVSVKNVANLYGELWKTNNRRINRFDMRHWIKKLYGETDPGLDRQYVQDLENHIFYAHDESNTAVGTYYTFSPREVVYAKLDGEPVLASLETIYRMCREREEMREKDDVWVKHPKDLYVQDRNGWTRVTMLTRKRRHRDLVVVKTSFGENLVVTDNHPLIVSDDISDTVEAVSAMDSQQYRCGSVLSFEGIDEVDLSLCVDFDRVFSNYIITHNRQCPYYFSKRYVKMDRSLGYVVGFFIGDGNYNNTSDHIIFSQKEQEILNRLSEMLFESFGIVSYIEYNQGIEKYYLTICSKILSDFFRNFLGIKDKAHNKCLPVNLLSFNEEFAKGIIEGLIDSDGTVQEDCSIQIRLASRECIQQLTMLLRYFGYGVSNSTQSTVFGNNNKIKTNYTIWGIIFTHCPSGVPFDYSIKWKERVTRCVDKFLKYSEGWSKVTKVTPLVNASFLELCEFIYDVTTESHTFVCNNLWVHNCKAVSMWDFLIHGTSSLDNGGHSAPHNLHSFAGQFCNLVFLNSSQCKGAVAYAEIFLCMSYYCRKDFDFEDGWLNHVDDIVSIKPRKTLRQMLCQYFQQITYSINQPAGNRGFQSPFTNISYFDHNYWNAVFQDFVFPDGSRPSWEEVDFLQRLYMKWFNEERTHTLLTFPVETMALLSDGKDIIDKDYKNLTAEMYAEGHSFFTYISDNPDSLASCCRLRNEIQENTFSFTNGLTGVQTGSANVITLNMSRIIQNWAREKGFSRDFLKEHFFEVSESFVEYLKVILERYYKYQTAYKERLYNLERHNMLTASNAGYISMSKLYSTCGLNGLNEAAEFVGLQCRYNEPYKRFCKLVTGTISSENRRHNKPGYLFNTELVPAENLSSKNYNWDKEDGYWVPGDRVLYNSYFYKADDPATGVLEKFRLHGRDFTSTLDGGVGLHCNLQEHLSKEQYMRLIEFAVANGTSYFTFNVPNSECTNRDCHLIVKRPLDVCPRCGAPMNQYTRIIGYLRPLKDFDRFRQIEARRRWYAPAEGATDDVPAAEEEPDA